MRQTMRRASAKGRPNLGLAGVDCTPAITNGKGQPESAVGGCNEFHQKGKRAKFTRKVERGAAPNYQGLGKRLADCGDLYRHQDGYALVQVLADGKTRLISKGSHLAPVIVDRIQMLVQKDGKTVGELPAANHLNAMLRSEQFLGQFTPVDVVTSRPFYMQDFSLARPGYSDGGAGWRVLYLGPEPTIADRTEAIERFLDVMAFASNADRTNTVAAALTVLLRCQWPGQNPVVVVTGTMSHCGKGTVTDFFCGNVAKADVLYEAQDWPTQAQFQRQLRDNAEIGVVLFDNVRCDSAGRSKFIRSGFVESFVTNPEMNLAAPSVGEAMHIENKFQSGTTETPQ